MRRLRIILWTGLTSILILVGYFTLRGFGVLGRAPLVRARTVPTGDQEIAWIQSATNASSWERFVAAVRQVEQSSPGLKVDYRGAFPEHTAAVPELALSFDHAAGKLWIRWYKLTSDAGQQRLDRRAGAAATRRRWRSSAAAPATGPASWPVPCGISKAGRASRRCCC